MTEAPGSQNDQHLQLQPQLPPPDSGPSVAKARSKSFVARWLPSGRTTESPFARFDINDDLEPPSKGVCTEDFDPNGSECDFSDGEDPFAHHGKAHQHRQRQWRCWQRHKQRVPSTRVVAAAGTLLGIAVIIPWASLLVCLDFMNELLVSGGVVGPGGQHQASAAWC